MSIPVIAFFNNKGGVGKTSLVYHLSWMYSKLHLNVLAADLDPQANLTAAFLNEDRLEKLWPEDNHENTVYGSLEPLIKGTGDIRKPYTEYIEPNLNLLVGDLALSLFEDELATEWSACVDRKERAFRIVSALARIIQKAAEETKSDVILMDLGPNLGAINRAALIASDYVVIPLSPDLFSLQGLKNLGPTLRRWREEWDERKAKKPSADLELPEGIMNPVGYVVLQHSVRLDRAVKAYDRWMARIPGVYRKSVLNSKKRTTIPVSKDEYCLAQIKHYRSLMPMAQEANLPVFLLKPADGAIGSHYNAVRTAFKDFKNLAKVIAAKTDVAIPQVTLFAEPDD